MSEAEIRKYVRGLTARMTVSFVLWIVIVVMQGIIGTCTVLFYGYGIATLALMVYNLIGCIRYYRNIQIIRECHTEEQLSRVFRYFENSIPMCWLFMFLNLIFGGFIGFVGNLYDLILACQVRKYSEKITQSGFGAYREIP